MSEKYKPSMEEWLKADSSLTDEQRKMTLEREYDVSYGRKEERVEKKEVDTPEGFVRDFESMLSKGEAGIWTISFVNNEGATDYGTYSTPKNIRSLQIVGRNDTQQHLLTETCLYTEKEPYNEVVCIWPAYTAQETRTPRPPVPVVEKGLFGSKTRYKDGGYETTYQHEFLKTSDVLPSGSSSPVYVATMARWFSFKDSHGRRGVFETNLILPEEMAKRLGTMVKNHPEILNEIIKNSSLL